MVGAHCDIGSSVASISDVCIPDRNLSRAFFFLYVTSRHLVVTVPWPKHSVGGWKAVTVLV